MHSIVCCMRVSHFTVTLCRFVKRRVVSAKMGGYGSSAQSTREEAAAPFVQMSVTPVSGTGSVVPL